MHCSRAQFGALGEACAAAYLQAAGYRILAQNVRIGGVEIDLIALHARVLVFVEVKARRSATHGRAEEAVDLRKQTRLVRGACAWLQMQRQSGASLVREMRGMRFDVIACELEAQAAACGAPPTRPFASTPAATDASAAAPAGGGADTGSIRFTAQGTPWRIRHFANAFDANF